MHCERDAAVVCLAEHLERETRDLMPVFLSGLITDLLNAALSEVNWGEIAESLLDEVADETEPEESKNE
jgi:hypothetical protein